MRRRWRRPHSLALIVVAFIALCPLMVYRAMSGPPGYRDCVRALERVTVGMGWGEVEAHLADAVAAGGVREEEYARWIGAAAVTVELTCYRNGDQNTPPQRYTGRSVWEYLVSVNSHYSTGIPFVPVDYTWLWVDRRGDIATAMQMVDCLVIDRIDDFGAPYGRYGCWPH